MRPPESLSLFMQQKPRTAKRLFFDIIPKTVDEYHQHLRAFEGQDPAARLENPVWHIHGPTPPRSDMEVSFTMLLNLASAASADDKSVLVGLYSEIRARRDAGDAIPSLDEAADVGGEVFPRPREARRKSTARRTRDRDARR